MRRARDCGTGPRRRSRGVRRGAGTPARSGQGSRGDSATLVPDKRRRLLFATLRSARSFLHANPTCDKAIKHNRSPLFPPNTSFRAEKRAGTRRRRRGGGGRGRRNPLQTQTEAGRATAGNYSSLVRSVPLQQQFPWRPASGRADATWKGPGREAAPPPESQRRAAGPRSSPPSRWLNRTN